MRARVESTREERARHSLTPYQLHLLRVPVLRLALDVQRGGRRSPLDLD
ncbi:hypothetical protein GCM10023086_75470 [Streptomyces venetus]|uniref:Uncharacterized protein n=1 Tax=Streptomyces venetus TaxID=1701086 RepID=A0ABP8HJD5_9ACTN